MIKVLRIYTEYPDNNYYTIKIINNKVVIQTNNKGIKVSGQEQKNMLDKLFIDYDASLKIIPRNITMYFKNFFIPLESFRDINDNIIQDLIDNEDNSYEYNKIGSFGFLCGDTKPVRLNFIKVSKQYPNKLEYISTNVFRKNDNTMLSWLDIKKKFKYLIDLPGHTYTTKLYTMLFCKRLIFLVKNRTHCFAWENDLKPYIHYIPVNNNFSDIIDKYNWAEKNEDKVKLIIQNAYNLGINKLHPDILKEKIFNKITSKFISKSVNSPP